MGLLKGRTWPLWEQLEPMLHDQILPFFHWVEACSIVVYVENRSPHHALGRKTLEEAFSRKSLKLGTSISLGA
jgi:hypothetical protein